MSTIIRKISTADVGAITSIWNEVIDEGMSFFWKEHFTNEDITKILVSQKAAYCSESDHIITGFYILHDNFPGRGNHIANALYAVKGEYRGNGIGKLLGNHSIEIAKNCSYTTMQFNSVVSSNKASIALWESLGFLKAGQIQSAFLTDLGEYLDIFIYFKELES